VALVRGHTGEVVRIIQKPDLAAVRADLEGLRAQGFENIAIGFMHSYTYPEHELQVANLASEMGFKVSASSILQSMARFVPRSQSAVADAYLTPMTLTYLDGFRKNFKGHLEDENVNKLLVCQSDGGLTSWSKFTGLRGVLSGPAGGVVGLSRTCYDDSDGTPVLGFDMVRMYTFLHPGTLLTYTKGRYQHRCCQVFGSPGAHFRKHHCRSNDTDPSARHQHSSCRRRFHTQVAKWAPQSRPQQCRSQSWSCLLW